MGRDRLVWPLALRRVETEVHAAGVPPVSRRGCGARGTRTSTWAAALACSVSQLRRPRRSEATAAPDERATPAQKETCSADVKAGATSSGKLVPLGAATPDGSDREPKEVHGRVHEPVEVQLRDEEADEDEYGELQGREVDR